jgi:LPXTG-motif cell wall-anchored protein
MSITRSPRRQRFGLVTLLIGAALTLIGLVAPPAQAADAPAKYTTGYDSYLHGPHRGSAPGDANNSPDCPENAVVDGMTSLHFVLRQNTHTISTLTVTFTISGSDVEYANMTPKTTSQWGSFDPTTNFITHPTGKHAYVYTPTNAVLVDAAAQDSPDSTGPIMNLSHVCLGTGETDGSTDNSTDNTDVSTDSTDDGTTDDTDDGTTDDTDDGTTDDTDDGATDDTDDGATDDTTDDVLGTAGSTDDSAKPPVEVEGEVITPDQLPATGAEDRSLLVLGLGFLAIGSVVLIAKRSVFIG